MRIDGDDVAGRGGLFLALLDGRSWTVEVAMEPVGIALEAARDRFKTVVTIVGRYEAMIDLFRKFEKGRSMAVLQELRNEIEACIDADLLDPLRICDLILACQGYQESAARVGGHLIVIALRGHWSPADQAYRIQQALGWATYASGVHLTDVEYVAAADIATVDLLGYRTAKTAGVERLDPRLLQHSMRITDEVVIPGVARYMPSELAFGMPKRLFGTPYRWRWNGSSCEYPQSSAGLIAQVISARLPPLAGYCDAIVQKPDDVGAIRALMAALLDYPADTSEEAEEMTRLLAQMGDRAALLDGACFLMRRAYHKDAGNERRHSVSTILGLIAVASGARPITEVELHQEDGALDVAAHAGQFLLDEIMALGAKVSKRGGGLKALRERARGDQESIDADLAPDHELLDIADEPTEEPERAISIGSTAHLGRGGYVRICGRISDTGARDHKEIESRYSVLTSAMKLQKSILSSHGLRESLLTEFPHCGTVISAITDDLAQREMNADGVFGFRPILLLGSPGCGKSRLANRIGTIAKITTRMYAAAGVGDSHFAGLSRGWHSSMPSAPVELIRSSGCPNPIVVVDEVEKAATSRRNGNIIDALLPMLEASTAKAWVDPFIQAECNLSYVSWIFTANHVADLPSPFLDRVRVVEVPAPGLECVEPLAKAILQEMRPLGQRFEMMPDLDDVEVKTLVENWAPGLSIRSLQRMVAAIVRARDEIAPRH